MPRTGEGIRPDDEAEFSNSPYLNFNDDKLKFDMNDVDKPNENYGSVSVSVPKSLLTGRWGIREDALSLTYSPASVSTRRASCQSHRCELAERYISSCR